MSLDDPVSKTLLNFVASVEFWIFRTNVLLQSFVDYRNREQKHNEMPFMISLAYRASMS
jgi:hypothetical protein